MMKVYVDSSYDTDKGVAGIGIAIKDGLKERTHSFWIPAENNNVGEMFAIYIASILASCKDATIYTDSQTALSYIDNNIKEKPRTQQQYYVHQKMRLYAYKIRQLNARVEKIKAHQHKYQQHSLGNDMADLMAKTGLAKFYEK